MRTSPLNSPLNQYPVRWPPLHVLPVLAVALLPTVGNAAVITVDHSCTLVEAIRAANEDVAWGGCASGAPGEDTIRLTSDVVLLEADNVTEGPNGLPVIDSEIRIRGHGFEIRRFPDEHFRFFNVAAGGSLTLVETTLRYGSVDSDLDGGSIWMSPGSVVDLLGSAIFDSFAAGNGGAIYNKAGALSIFDSEFEENTAESTDSLEAGGGALYGVSDNGSDCSMFILNSEFSNNSALSVGGAIASLCDDFHLIESTIYSNEAGVGGGGVSLDGDSRVERSTFESNIVHHSFWGFGGGLDAGFRHPWVINSTFAYNRAKRGSAIFSYGDGLDVVNTTIQSNNLFLPLESSYALQHDWLFAAEAKNSVVAHNYEDNCKDVTGGLGNFTDASDSTCPGFATTTYFGFIGANGGPTRTIPLEPDAEQVDASFDCDVPIDQRRYGRVDGACDSGSFELDGVPPPNLALSGECPGEVTLQVTGATPNSFVTLVRDDRIGRSEIPNGFCEGTEHLLETPTVVRRIPTDAAGEATLQATLPLATCRYLLQVVDTNTCLVSTVERQQM